MFTNFSDQYLIVSFYSSKEVIHLQELARETWDTNWGFMKSDFINKVFNKQLCYFMGRRLLLFQLSPIYNRHEYFILLIFYIIKASNHNKYNTINL